MMGLFSLQVCRAHLIAFARKMIRLVYTAAIGVVGEGRNARHLQLGQTESTTDLLGLTTRQHYLLCR